MAKRLIKNPLVIRGLGVEPKTSTPIPLSEEVQQTLSIPVGKTGNVFTPIRANMFGNMGIDPFDRSGLTWIGINPVLGVVTDLGDYYNVGELFYYGGFGYCLYGINSVLPEYTDYPLRWGFAAEIAGVAVGACYHRIVGHFRYFYIDTTLGIVTDPYLLVAKKSQSDT